MTHKLQLLFLLTLIAGCGGGSKVAAHQGSINPQGAANVVTQTSGMVSALKSNDGATLSAHVSAIAFSGAQQIVGPGRKLTSAAAVPGTSGTFSCDNSGCRYDMFMAGGFTYNGGINATPEGDGMRVVADLTIKGSVSSGGTGETIDWKLDAALSVTPSLIDGSLQSTGTGSVTSGSQTFQYTYHNLVEYQKVTLDANGKPTGGSVHALWSVMVSGQDQANQAWEGTVNFGG